MQKKILKVGVIGVGHLGQHHVKHYLGIENIKLCGVYDVNIEQGIYISNKFKVKVFDSLKEIISVVDAVSIVTPTTFHAKVAEYCIKNKKHVFIEKPITSTIKEANKLIQLADENKVIIQVGHIERLNPALKALEPYNLKPKFIEIQRLAPYNTRGTDVPVVLDKMIHDIDILLSLVNADVFSISASGLSILTDSIDIAHARIKFANGCVASIMSSRIAKDEVRKIKTFQQDLYTTVDLYKGITEIYKIDNEQKNKTNYLMKVPFEYNDTKKFIIYEKPEVKQEDALKLELLNFRNSVNGIEKPIVSGQAGKEALAVALKIQEKIIEDFK